MAAAKLIEKQSCICSI